MLQPQQWHQRKWRDKEKLTNRQTSSPLWNCVIALKTGSSTSTVFSYLIESLPRKLNWNKEPTGHLLWALKTAHLSSLNSQASISISLKIFTSRRFGGTALTFSTFSVQQPTVSASSSSCDKDQQLSKFSKSKLLKRIKYSNHGKHK